MTSPTRPGRGRRKFVFGVLEQAANILGAMTASIMVVGVLLPALAASAGMASVNTATFVSIAWLVIGLAVFTGAGSMVLRGLARRLEDDDGELVEVEAGTHH